MASAAADTFRNKKFYIFGYPIAHSATPAFHNHVFNGLQTGNKFSLWSASKITDEVLDIIKSDDCGGCAVTMPLKAAMLSFLDEISLESKMTAAVNTIVKVPASSGFKLVGQNTDILGVRNSLLRGLCSQFPDESVASNASYTTSTNVAGLIIGGGATTRSAAYALTLLGLFPIYLINRDVDEIQQVMEAMPHLSSKSALIHLQSPEDVEHHLGQNDSPKVVMAVGCIPSVLPKTVEERMVYSTLTSALTIPYQRPAQSDDLPIPKQRIFLEMPYKPRQTPILRIANALGWYTMTGVRAMIEQGLAQQRMWLTGIPTIEIGSDTNIIPPEIELSVRVLAEEMEDIVVCDEDEVDRAYGKPEARVG